MGTGVPLEPLLPFVGERTARRDRSPEMMERVVRDGEVGVGVESEAFLDLPDLVGAQR